MSQINGKVITATKWSSISEIVAKLITPLSTIVLARLLAPDAFGVLVMTTMVISFAEIFTDAGFQRYLIQHEFESDIDLEEQTTVAFWTNLVLSLLIWAGIWVFANDLATLLGEREYSNIISISCVCIPLAAFSSIQMALFKRVLDFKTLFFVRFIGCLIPLVVTIPLAYFTRSYWALIIGMIVLNLSNALLLTIKSTWKPRFFFRWKQLKKMLSFSLWSMLEAVSIWMTGYIDIFIVGMYLSQYYLGLYSISMTTVGQIISIITAATTPVLFSSLSRIQNNFNEFKSLFFQFQKIVALLVIPLGVGIYLFREMITLVLLGNQWLETSYFIGLWGLTSSITIIFSHYCSEVYRAKGRPDLSVWVQLSHVLFLVPFILWAVRGEYNFLCEVRTLVRLELIVANLLVIWLFVKITPWEMLKNVYPELIATIVMAIVVLLLPQIHHDYLLMGCYIIVAILVYMGIIMLFPRERNLIFNFKKIISQK